MRKDHVERVIHAANEALRATDDYTVSEGDCARAFAMLYAAAIQLSDPLVLGLAHTALLLNADYVSDERDMTRVMTHMVERLELLLTVAT